MKGTFQFRTWKIERFCFTLFEFSHGKYGSHDTYEVFIRTGHRVLNVEINTAQSSTEYNEDHMSIEKDMVK